MQTGIYILGELSDADTDWIVNNGAKEILEIGATLIRQGEQIDGLYILLDGLFAVIRDGQAIARLSSGDIVGEMSFIELRPASASVRVYTEGTVFKIARDRLIEKIESDEGFAARFYRALAMFLSHRLRAMSGDADAQSSQEIRALEIAKARFEQMIARLNAE